MYVDERDGRTSKIKDETLRFADSVATKGRVSMNYS